MNKIIEFFKRIFSKRTLALNETENLAEPQNKNLKESFLDSIKTENKEDSLLLQQKLEKGLIDESKLSNEQIIKIKDLYCRQISNLMDSINNYKLKLKQN